jgi:hypothetical protein
MGRFISPDGVASREGEGEALANLTRRRNGGEFRRRGRRNEGLPDFCLMPFHKYRRGQSEKVSRP